MFVKLPTIIHLYHQAPTFKSLILLNVILKFFTLLTPLIYNQLLFMETFSFIMLTRHVQPYVSSVVSTLLYIGLLPCILKKIGVM